MSISMNLEADYCLNRRLFIRVLKDIGVDAVIETENSVSGNFPVSNMFFCFEEEPNGQIKAEGLSYEIAWAVKARVVFYYVISEYEKCSDQLHMFLVHLSQLSPANFVLSFQYERVYAFRDKDGLKFLDKF